MIKDLNYEVILSHKSIEDFVESFWLLQNQSDEDREIMVLPDGRIDLIFIKIGNAPFQRIILGLETKPGKTLLKAHTTMVVISFKPLAIEYIFRNSLMDVLSNFQYIVGDEWNFSEEELVDFHSFTVKATKLVQSYLPEDIDSRKINLFKLIYSHAGNLAVQNISDEVFWASRQINRYFNKHFNLSLKTYCKIIRFRACFPHIKKGKIYPEQNFADQSHFIKEIKKLSGALPKDLRKNKNDRFIQFSVLP